ncbi:MAG TPA: ABC transporter substrate-binding protein [Solirubrobacteraceae bacterium]
MEFVTKRSAVLALLLSAGAIAGCGSSSSTPAGTSGSSGSTGTSAAAPPTTAANPAVAKLVPASVKSKGTLTVAADATYPPDESIASDGHTVVGMDPDLVKALATVMGLKANVSNVTFDSIIPGLAAGKYDMGASSFTDNKLREKTVNFVDYASVGESFYTKTQGGTAISSIADICGKTVAVEKGTTEQNDATAQSSKCKKAGKPAVTVLTFPDQNGANLAVSSGKAQLGFADTPPAIYVTKKSGGQFKLVGAQYATAPYGLAIPKGTTLDKAVLAAMKVLVNNGTYGKIFEKWGLKGSEIPVSQVKINGATS